MNARLILLLIGMLSISGCKDVDVTDPKVAAALAEINSTFQQDYQTILAEIGTRHYSVDRPLAIQTMRRTLEQLGFTVIHSEGDYYLHVSALAPLPLDDAEWRQVRASDEPVFRDIASKHLGIKGRLAKLEPEGLNIIGTLTFLETGDGVDITITMRMKEIKLQPPESILPRREYPPPSAVRIGYSKIWQSFEEQALPLARMVTRG